MVRGPAQDKKRAFRAQEERSSRKSTIGQPALKDYASSGKRRRIRQFGRRVMLMVKYYSCLGWPFKSQASVWQLSQVDESMVPQSRPSSKNSDHKEDSRCASPEFAKDASPSGAKCDDASNPRDHKEASSVASPIAESKTTQLKSRSINLQDKDTRDGVSRSSLPKGVSTKPPCLPQPWIDTSTLDDIDHTSFFNRETTDCVEKESLESILLQAIETPLPEIGPSTLNSLLDCPGGQLDSEAYIESLFQQAIRTPLPEETATSRSAITSKPSSPRGTLVLLRPPSLDFSPPNHSEKNTISRAMHATQSSTKTAGNNHTKYRLPSLLDPICLTPPTISSSTEGALPKLAHSDTRPSAPPRISSRYSLRLRSRFGSNKSTRSKRHDQASQPSDGEPESPQRPCVTRRDSVLSIQEQVKGAWSRSPTPLPPVEVSRGRYKAYVPDFPPLDPSLFALSPNFDDEVRVAAAVRLPDGEDDDDDDEGIDDEVYDEDADVGLGVSPTPPPPLPQKQPTKPLAARALSLRRRSRDGLVASLTRSDAGIGDGDRIPTSTSTPVLAAVQVGQNILEGVCNRCRVKLASVWPRSTSATVVCA
ncbi:hypothetical protein HDK77DRAFT_514230 [Phyllosticta capitalensis]